MSYLIPEVMPSTVNTIMYQDTAYASTLLPVHMLVAACATAAVKC